VGRSAVVRGFFARFVAHITLLLKIRVFRDVVLSWWICTCHCFEGP